jgi:hypothetical protein
MYYGQSKETVKQFDNSYCQMNASHVKLDTCKIDIVNKIHCSYIYSVDMKIQQSNSGNVVNIMQLSILHLGIQFGHVSL